ncbi:hypothetical protein, partial [Novipirellula maiorica]|uniref:hypothetical protein n=1 Tax=Novipirellula maiorica TaxID=1265734 RepID=UPI00059423C9
SRTVEANETFGLDRAACAAPLNRRLGVMYFETQMTAAAFPAATRKYRTASTGSCVKKNSVRLGPSRTLMCI